MEKDTSNLLEELSEIVFTITVQYIVFWSKDRDKIIQKHLITVLRKLQDPQFLREKNI